MCGFGGLRDHDGHLLFMPRLPKALSRLCFRLTFNGRRLEVEIEQGEARYRLLEGEPLEITHHGDGLTVAPGEPVSARIPSPPELPAPAQPAGRAPVRRQKPA